MLEKPYRCTVLLEKVEAYTQAAQEPASQPAAMFFEGTYLPRLASGSAVTGS